MYITGINPTQTWTSTETPSHTVGATGMDSSGRVYVLGKADSSGVTGAGYVVAFEAGAADCDMVETTVSAPGTAQGMRVGVAMAAVSASGFGWFCVYGFNVDVQVLASCAKGTRLNTTATAGALDDDGTAGAEELCGIGLDAARAASQGNAAATVTWPYVGRTL